VSSNLIARSIEVCLLGEQPARLRHDADSIVKALSAQPWSPAARLSGPEPLDRPARQAFGWMPRSTVRDPLDMALGRTIRRRRSLLGLSQEQLGASCGVSFQQIQKYENGANRVSFSRLVLIARALNCRVSDLVVAFDGPGADCGEAGDSPADTAALLAAYRGLNPEQRRRLVSLAEVISSH
jgi:transcriptional regulator with XRE-family HTH domain